MKKKILRGKILRPALNRIYKDSDNHESEKVQKCTDSNIFVKRHIDKKESHKRRSNKYYFS